MDVSEAVPLSSEHCSPLHYVVLSLQTLMNVLKALQDVLSPVAILRVVSSVAATMDLD